MERKERRFQMGIIELLCDPEQADWDSIADLAAWWSQGLLADVEAIRAVSSTKPTRLSFRVQENFGQYHEGAELVMYGHRPETDKELASRVRAQEKRKAKKAAEVVDQEAHERAQLAKLKAKYSED